MKKILLTILAVFTVQAVYADAIYLNDNTVLKGTIIQITGTEVEYDPEGPSTFDTVRKDQVAKIIYSNGREQRFILDTLILTSGESIKCNIVRVTKESITYKPEGTEEEKTIGRDQVARMEFSDGKTVELSKQTAPDQKNEAATKPSGGYLDSIIRISLFGGGGVMSGGAISKERRVFRAYKPDFILANGFPDNYLQYTGSATGGFEMDLMPPAIKFFQRRGFDFTGIKFGIRGRYGYENGTSAIIGRDDNNWNYNGFDKNETGRLMTYHYWSAGPVMNFVFTPRNNVFNFMISIYGMAGQVFSGNLTPLSSLRGSKLLMTRLAGAWNGYWNTPAFMGWANPYTIKQLNNTGFNGYTVRVGIGPEFSLNKYFPIIVGFHLTYAYTGLTFDKAPLVYADGHKKSAHSEVGGEVSVGLHF
jgi:hypothetical protein